LKENVPRNIPQAKKVRDQAEINRKHAAAKKQKMLDLEAETALLRC
jgi:hypothetical protein